MTRSAAPMRNPLLLAVLLLALPVILTCPAAWAMDRDGDGYHAEEDDCWDEEPEVHPGAVEVADGVDQDCDGVVDEGTENYDDDGDGLSEAEGDCDDGDPAVFPGAEEVAGGVDDNCDGRIDEGTVAYDDDGDGYSEEQGDCDDSLAALSPGREERCTAEPAEDDTGEPPPAWDEDCDGQVDEGCAEDDGDSPYPSPAGACGTGSSGAGSAWALLWVAGLLGARRRGRPLGLAGVLLLGALPATTGCDDPTVGITEEERVGQVGFEIPWVDYGAVYTGDEARDTVPLRNHGNATVTVLDIQADPEGWVTPDAAMVGKVMSPQAPLDVDVVFHPPEEGPVAGELIFVLDRDAEDSIALPFYGQGVPARPVFVPAIVDLGQVTGKVSREVSLFNPGPTRLTLFVAGMPAEPWSLDLDVSEDQSLLLEPDEALEFTVSVNTWEPTDEELVLELPGGAELVLPVRANICDDQTVDVSDRDGDGFTLCGGDCDDENPYRHPGRPDPYPDGQDWDCDGLD